MSITKKRTPSRGADGKFTRNISNRQRKIIINLAEQIEKRSRERFEEKSLNLRKQILDTLRLNYPHSGDDVLLKIGLTALTQKDADEDVIFAEIRELNTGIIANENDIVTVTCPI